MPDHLTTIPPSHEIVLEAWSVITGLARETTRVRVGQLVTSNSYRNPALQAKMASTVDVISQGRFVFGIGAGWWEPDYVGYGYDFGTAGDRLRHLDEAAQVILALWTEEKATFDGTHYQLREAVNEPKGVQKPHIPLLIAGGGEKITLRVVAKYADACNIMDSAEVAEHKFAVLKKHCEEVGRNYDEVNRTVTTVAIIADTDEEARALIPPGVNFAYPGDLGSYGLIGTIDTVRERIAAFEAAGVQELVIGFGDPTSVEQVWRVRRPLRQVSRPRDFSRLRRHDMSTRNLSGTTAIVTGASRGFGRATAIALANRGARVIGVARSEAPLNELHSELGDHFHPEIADVTDPSLPDRLIAQYRPQTLVLNAGATPPVGSLLKQTWETFSTNWNVDVQHVFHFTRAALNAPLHPGSVVVSLSSGAALRGSPLSGGYAGAKSTIKIISSYAALEARRTGSDIRFVAVLPQLTSATDLGRVFTQAYGTQAGITEAQFLEGFGGTLDADQAGTSITDFVVDDSFTAPAYLLAARGLWTALE